jgi:hypothetical protein
LSSKPLGINNLTFFGIFEEKTEMSRSETEKYFLFEAQLPGNQQLNFLRKN